MKTKLLFPLFFLFTFFILNAQNLVAYYPFNANANDESGNANNGNVNGATLTTDRFGNANSAYYFDGVSSYISITDNPNLNIQTGQSFSISFWAKHDAQNNGIYMISKYKGSFGEPSYGIGTGSYGDSYSWFEFTPSNGLENRGTIDLNDNNWHNITTVFKSGESVSIYVDGILDISKITTYTGSIINTRNLTIGCGSNLAQFYKGSIDDVKIYDKALSETEIKNEVNGLVAYYPFNGNANDESGSENNGTVNGASLTTDRFGNTNSAYHFNGVDNDITCLFPGPLGASPRTISFWAKTSDVATGNYDNAIISYGSNNIYGQRFEIDVNSQTRGLGIDINGAALTKDFDNSNNGWHFYTAVFDGGTNKTMYDVKLYADGNLLTTNTFEIDNGAFLNTSSEIPIHIGSLFNTYRFFNGDIDEVKFYNKALTETEIKNEFKSLIAYYPFNGNANDESGNNHNGTVNGATPTTDRFGNINSAYEFNGTDNYIDIGDWENGGPMSFTFWARWDAFNNYSRIIDLGNGSSSNNIIISNYQTNNGLFFSNYTSGETKLINTNTITQNQWDFYAATVDENGIMTLYKNGEQIAQKTDGVTPNTILRTQQFIGKSNFSQDGYFEGAIDELKIYNKKLTQDEIKNDYSDLIAYYPFNGNANDESGNNHDGAVNGAILTTDRFGSTESAYLFNGSNSSISVPHDSQLNLENDLSISAWVKPITFPSSLNVMILGKSNYTSATNYLLRVMPNGYIMFEYKTITTSTDNPVLLNQWNHIVVVSNATEKKIYVNNVLAATATITSPYGTVTSPLTIGAASYNAEYFNGSIDDIRIYSMALTDSQVSSLYTNNTLAVQKVDLNTDSTFYVYNNILHFKNTQNLTEIKNVEVYNLLGQKVFGTSKIENEISFQNITKGIHFLKIENQNGNFSSLKFIVN